MEDGEFCGQNIEMDVSFVRPGGQSTSYVNRNDSLKCMLDHRALRVKAVEILKEKSKWWPRT